MTVPRRGWASLVVLVLILVTGCSGSTEPPGAAAPSLQGQDVENLYRMPDVVVRDLEDHPYRLAASPSTPVVVLMLGYTRCGQDCDALLTALSTAMASLDDTRRQRVTVLHLTVDPEHDTDPRQRRYLAEYPLAVTGLCADEPTTLQVAHKIGVTLKYGGTSTKPVRTSIQASAFVDGQAVVRWTPMTGAADLSTDLRTLTG